MRDDGQRIPPLTLQYQNNKETTAWMAVVLLAKAVLYLTRMEPGGNERDVIGEQLTTSSSGPWRLMGKRSN